MRLADHRLCRCGVRSAGQPLRGGVAAPPQGIGLAPVAAEFHKRWEFDPTLLATLAALAVGDGGEWPPSGLASSDSEGATASAGS